MQFCQCVLPLLLLATLQQTQAHVKVVAHPVVYTNNNGGGVDELQVPPSSEASKLFDAGGAVIAAWWAPYDNIGDLPAIHRIQTVPAGNHVNLVVHGLPNHRNARVRITIYALMTDNETFDIDIRSTL